MEREIKFRGKRIDTQMWVYGGFHLHEEKQLCMATKEQVLANKKALILVDGMADWGLSKDIKALEVDLKTVGQFTGLRDKNGKEIYEGDIIADKDEKYRVYSIPGGFTIKAPFWAMYLNDVLPGDELIMTALSDTQNSSYISQSMEVIGNVFENKDLLK